MHLNSQENLRLKLLPMKDETNKKQIISKAESSIAPNNMGTEPAGLWTTHEDMKIRNVTRKYTFISCS